MQDIKLGRWVVRVALAVGVGGAVLGGTFAANAATTTPASGTVYQLPSHGGLLGRCVLGDRFLILVLINRIWTRGLRRSADLPCPS